MLFSFAVLRGWADSCGLPRDGCPRDGEAHSRGQAPLAPRKVYVVLAAQGPPGVKLTDDSTPPRDMQEPSRFPSQTRNVEPVTGRALGKAPREAFLSLVLKGLSRAQYNSQVGKILPKDSSGLISGNKLSVNPTNLKVEDDARPDDVKPSHPKATDDALSDESWQLCDFVGIKPVAAKVDEDDAVSGGRWQQDACHPKARKFRVGGLPFSTSFLPRQTEAGK